MANNNTMQSKYYTVEQLANYSNLSVPTIRRYMRYDGLPHFRINRRILISINEFDQWMEQRRQNQTEQQTNFDQIVKEIVDDFRL